MGRIAWRLVSPLIALTFLPGAGAWAAETAAAQWLIAVNGGADDHGEIVLSFAEDGVEVAQIPAAIPKGTPENDVARRVRRALRRALPKDRYLVDVRSGEKVLVAARGHARNYELGLVRNTVPGTEVSVVRE